MSIINNKQIYKKKLKEFKEYECSYYIDKTGKIKYFQDINYRYKRYLCILKDILNFDAFILSIVGKNIDDIVENLLYLKFLQKQKLKYILLESFASSRLQRINIRDLSRYWKPEGMEVFKPSWDPLKKKDDIIYIFKEKNLDKLLNILFFVNLLDTNKFNINDVNDINYIENTDNKITNKLSVEFVLYKSKYRNIKNNKVLIYLFFKIYIYIIEDELFKKFNIKLDDFPSYTILYKFLKKNEYVDKFYNLYGSVIINNSKKINSHIASHSDLVKFKNEIKLKIHDFKNLDLLDLINNKIYQNFNKTYIKNKFLELSQKL